MNRSSTIVFAFLWLLPTAIFADQAAFFEKHIRPALIQHCYECHSEAKKTKGGLLLDRREGWSEGGDSGPAIVPGDLDKSLLIEAIRYGNPDTEMPPKGKLPDHVIAHIEKWVQGGAFDPRDKPASLDTENDKIDIEKGKEFWSFQPVRKPDIPAGDGAPIDRLINERLKEKNFRANGPAPAELRLRRAKTDLTGLLPSIAEQDEFLADPSETKFAEMIDRWLESREFGERWGRHWLDLARYADTSGGGRAMPLPEAWRYRDFVIDSFTNDMPIDEMIRLQIAGDLLPWNDDYQVRERNLIATGFLVLGPHNYENQNKALLDLEIADEQVDTIGRAFLGMTIGCARCHDHKFDPIPTADYYSMAGIFLSTKSVSHSNVSRWHTEPIPPTREQQEARDRLVAQKKILEREISEAKKLLAKKGRGSGGADKSMPVSALPGIVIDNVDAEKIGEWMISTHSSRWVGDHYIHDQQASRGKKAVIYRHRFEKPGDYELRISYSSSSNRNPKTPVTVGLPGDILKIYTVNQILKPEHDHLFQTIDNFEVKAGDEIFVKISNDTKHSGVVIADSIQWLPPLVEEPAVATSKPEADTLSKNEIKQLEKALKLKEAELRKLNKSAPKPPKAMCAVDQDPKNIGDTEIRIRGTENNLGPKVGRGFLQVASWVEPKISEGSSGRLDLANWIVDSQNPLTSRVMANRIWAHLMGRGIVESPDNFGTTGRLPSHPELLDYLATRLIENGWSGKALIREIMLSDVYSRSSSYRNDFPEAKSDPGNQLYWRGNQRFLDAEVIRDAMLSISDSLDKTSGGPSLPPGFRSEFGYTFKTQKRSIYVPVFRNQGYELFDLFDFANPNFAVGKRGSSTIPTQALFLKNSPFVHRQAELSASRLLEETAGLDDAARVDRIYREMLGRQATQAERELSLALINSSPAQEAGSWAGLIRSLYSCVDFRLLK